MVLITRVRIRGQVTAFHSMAERAGIGDGEKARDNRPDRAEVLDESDGTYGYRRVHADLAAWGVPVGPELVRSVMRDLGLEHYRPSSCRSLRR